MNILSRQVVVRMYTDTATDMAACGAQLFPEHVRAMNMDGRTHARRNATDPLETYMKAIQHRVQHL
jgi:hypothetical protein